MFSVSGFTDKSYTQGVGGGGIIIPAALSVQPLLLLRYYLPPFFLLFSVYFSRLRGPWVLRLLGPLSSMRFSTPW